MPMAKGFSYSVRTAAITTAKAALTEPEMMLAPLGVMLGVALGPGLPPVG